MHLIICYAFLLTVCCVAVHGMETGAPLSACTSMMPNHGVSEKTSDPPFTISLNGVTKYSAGVPVVVTVGGSTAFKGILLQVRDESGTTPLGTFSSPPTDTKLIACSSADTAVTHSNPNTKNDLQFTWNPPSENLGSIHFIATIAEEKTMFWINVMSDELSFDTADGGMDDATVGPNDQGGAGSEDGTTEGDDDDDDSDNNTGDSNSSIGISSVMSVILMQIAVCAGMLLIFNP